MATTMLTPRALRAHAFDRLANLSAVHPSAIHVTREDDLVKLCEPFQGQSTAADIPMSHRELEILLALCKTAPVLQDSGHATRLRSRLSPYLTECSSQAIAQSPSYRDVQTSPWELLTSNLVSAVLELGLRFPGLRRTVAIDVFAYITKCAQIATNVRRTEVEQDDLSGSALKSSRLWAMIMLTTSLLGFLDAAATKASFWSQQQRLEILSSFQSMLDEEFLVSCESTCSTIRNSRSSSFIMKDLKASLKHYDTAGRPLGALAVKEGFANFTEACAALLVTEPSARQAHGTLSAILMRTSKPSHEQQNYQLLEKIADVSIQEMADLDEGSDYIRLGSAWQQRRAQALKASCMTSYLCCAIIDEEAADPDLLLSWLERVMADPVQVADDTLGSACLQSLAILARTSDTVASNLSRTLPRVIVRRPLTSKGSHIAAECLLHVLRLLSQDNVITTLWGLGNSLSASPAEARAQRSLSADVNAENDLEELNGNANGSTISLANLDHAKTTDNHLTVIVAIITIARGFNDSKITALALSMLIQKVGKVNPTVDLRIITEAATLVTQGAASEFRALLRLYTRLSHEGVAQRSEHILSAVNQAQCHLAQTLKGGSALYGVFLEHLLQSIVAKGEVQKGADLHHSEFERAAHEMALLLKPLSLLVANNITTQGIEDIESFPYLQRDAWYNIVVHGFGLNSALGRKHMDELKVLARYSHPLIAEERADTHESPIELNMVLKRGGSSQGLAKHRSEMLELLPGLETEVRKLDYPELIFLKTAHLVETLRASAGDCTRIFAYFVDPRLRNTPLGTCTASVAVRAVEGTLRTTMKGTEEALSAPFVAQQLSLIFESCCHRVARVQEVAYLCAERIIAQVPSTMCQRSSIFALLDLLTIMWSSCLESDTDEYEWKPLYTTPPGTTSVQLSDNFDYRRASLRTLHRKAKEWITIALNLAPLDVKGLLQTYLSDYAEDEAFGHMSLGRSFALEMGATIPKTDQRLVAIETENELHINTASDFMAQYTSRQEYRFTDPTRSDALDAGPRSTASEVDKMNGESVLQGGSGSILDRLRDVDRRLLDRETIPLGELRDVLRPAASLLCGTSNDDLSVLGLFVKIPFTIFTKQSIKLGLSLWMGVVKENSRMESRLLVEIMENWVTTVNAGLGIFNNNMKHLDPFYLKEEFAPSDRDALARQQHRAHDYFAPHFRIFQFLASHYQASKLNGTSAEKACIRLFQATLRSLRHTPSHPLARELHFHIILLGLRVLRYNTTLDAFAQWRFKDQLLSVGLAWFRNPPRWSFGGNRLQVKAETHLLADVATGLHNVREVGTKSSPSRSSLSLKQDLLQLLLASEQSRLMVWLFPLDAGKRHHFAGAQISRNPTEDALLTVLGTAWDEDPSIAVNLVARFVSFQRLQQSTRQLVLQNARVALDEPRALPILFGSSLPNDVSSQLKYLAYWYPVDPITATTYFLPAYGNHPCIIQYAVRALESHSVDVTFFYVPQIVQTLRYDALGYVARYIIETAKFSQLFAHQIIWNIKANAYKDEDSQEPDPMKPTLDNVQESLISSFTAGDKDFYEREFAFFDNITGISGKLRPFLKKSKPEKKQKIEEELRKVHVDVGVYLPSNPEGIVVGIDRKSGKPLQSHAKTPYMATFRVRKERNDDMENTEDQLERVNVAGDSGENASNSYEIWQAAMFKVGDDCRQDVLALQMIATFRGIFNSVGLPVYVYPYRVTATAPGCGVIDILPRSISRDMLGREAVNGLYEWFISRFGSENSPAFQAARANFVKSLAAYSVISFLLQFKDRHNGNIMYDEDGHILHIDFGFCFDIAPGGVRFERAPFKLTKEMVAVLGGSTETQAFRWFEELCVKAFLASRQYVDTLANVVICMLDSGLPCFKPMTIQHFKERFVLEKSEREAAEFVRFLIRKSFEATSTKGYDYFQLLTNGIPY